MAYSTDGGNGLPANTPGPNRLTQPGRPRGGWPVTGWAAGVGDRVAGWKIVATSKAAPAVPPPAPGIEVQGPRFRRFGRAGDARLPADGDGCNDRVLGGPVQALRRQVNEPRATGRALEAGPFVTTGACVPLIPVLPGQSVEADFGWIGRIRARIV